MTANFSLRARWVLPIVGPPIEGGVVTVADGHIVQVGNFADAGAPVEDLGDVVLMPGLVNAHTHLEFSDLPAPLGQRGMSLPSWIRVVLSQRKRANRDAAAAIAQGLAESMSHGVTTIGEISSGEFSGPRFAAGQPVVLAFQEAIGFSAQRAESVFADVQRRFEAAPPPAGLSPHAPYTVHPRLLERIVALAAERSAPVAMHIAESRDELRLLADGDGEFRSLLSERSMWDAEAIPHASRPLNYLKQLATASRSLVIHGNYLAADEIEYLGQRTATMSVVFCPRTHAYFQHEPFPLQAMRAAGVRVAIGTDSRASNPDLNLLADVRFAAAHHPGVDPNAWLRMVTQDAAGALGLAGEIGSLQPGKRADMIALRCGADERDPESAVVSADAAVTRVCVAGVA